MSSPASTPRLLLLFSFVNFVIGSTAFVLTGILSLVAEGLDAPVAAVGQAMTAYALATAVLSPLAMVATGGWPRRHALLAGMVLFTAGGVLSALAETLGTLLAGRVLMGTGAMVTALMAGLAVSLVEPARRGRALAFVFMGVSISYVAGLPLGAWLGFVAGWQAPVWAGVVLSAMCGVLLWRMVPAHIAAPGASFAGLGALLSQRSVLSVYALTLLYFTAIFTVFSYIGPVLQALAPLGSAALSVTLAAFGVSGVVGTLLGGRAGDRFGPHRTIAVLLALLVVMMALLPLTTGHPAAMLAVLLAWGVAGFGMMAPQQARLAHLAGAQAPLALSLNSSMLYLGTALGTTVGGLAAAHIGFERLSWAGVPFAVVGWLLLMAGSRAAAPSVSAKIGA